MTNLTDSRRGVPAGVWKLPLGQRIRWARTTAKLSHDRLVDSLGRSNRGHLIKIEKGDHSPRPDLRDAIADATNVPRELFAEDEDEESDPVARMTLDQFLEARVRAIVGRVTNEVGNVTPTLIVCGAAFVLLATGWTL